MKTWSHKSVQQLLSESQQSDPREEIRQRARELALRAMQAGWSGPPFEAVELAHMLGIRVLPNDSINDARLLPQKGGSFLIEYNPFQKPTRINFSICHEIAHTLFSDCANEIRNREEQPTSNRELEELCNIAASELQLPYGYFTNDANEMETISIEDLISIAKKYKASLESVFIRFVEVTHLPCSIVIGTLSDRGDFSISYVKTSRASKKTIKAKDISIPHHSKLYDCIAPGWTSRETEEYDWLEEPSNLYYIGLSSLRGDHRLRVALLITPISNNDLLQERKILKEFGDATKPRGIGRKIICQVVNTGGALGAGFGKALAKNYPIVRDELNKWHKNKSHFQLGESNLIQISNELFVCQMLAQKGIFSKAGEIPLNYSSLHKCLVSLRSVASDLQASIHMPLIGAGQAKGDWKVIEGMIYDELVSYGLQVNIYVLPGKVPATNDKNTLSLFAEETTWQAEKLSFS